jgi:transcription elongation factor S-II
MDTFRNNFINKFNQILNDTDFSTRIEESCYTYSCEYCKTKNIPTTFTHPVFKDVYICKLRQLYSNLNENSYIKNTNLKTLFAKNKVDVSQIATLNYTELFPSKWKKFKKDLEIMNQEIFNNNVEQSETDQFQCGKCKQRRCTYYSLQTRSADEPMTNFITCLHCGTNWRE